MNEDSDDEDAFSAEQKEVGKEMDEIRAAQQWVNPDGCDLASEGFAFSHATGKEIDLRLNWSQVKNKLAQGADAVEETTVRLNWNQNSPKLTARAALDQEEVLRDYPLDSLDPTQRAFAARVLSWGQELVAVYKQTEQTGEYQKIPLLRTWLGGSGDLI